MSLEQREQFFKMKQKLELRKKQVKRAKQAAEEAEKKNPVPSLGASLGKFLRRRDTIEITNDDDSELLHKLKEWKKHKREYMSKMAENLAVDDNEKDKIKSMIVKLMTIETQIKEINFERINKAK